MSNPHTVVIEALNAAIQSAVVKSTRDLLAAISADYGIDLGELNDKYMKDLPEEFLPKKKKSAADAKVPCSAINKKKKPCMRFATEGSCYCKLHVRFFAENPDRVTFAEPVGDKPQGAPKRGATAAARAALVSPDDRSLRRNFDEVFDEVFTEETEDEDDARTVTDTEEETEIEIDEEPEPEEPEPEEPMKTPEEPMKTPEEPMKTPEEPMKTPEEPMKTPEEPTPEEPRKPQCVAISEKKKQRCKRPAANGSCYCKKHEPVVDDDDDLEKMLERALFGHEEEMI